MGKGKGVVSGGGPSLFDPRVTELVRRAAPARRSLPDLMNDARRLERQPGVTSQALGEAYFAVSRRAVEEGNISRVLEYAIKTMRLPSLPPKLRRDASFFFGRVVYNARQVGGAIADEAMRSLHDFVASGLRPILADLDEAERGNWLCVLHVAFPRAFHREQLFLGEKVFDEGQTPKKKCEGALAYLLTARRAMVRQLGLPIDRPKARTMAEFVLDNAAETIASRSEWEDEIFHTFIIDLNYFDLFDLQDRALALRRPAADDPVWLYLRLVRKMRIGPVDAMLELPGIFPLERDYNHTISSELSIVSTRIYRAFLDLRRKDIDARGASLRPQNWFERVLAQPRSRRPDLVRRIKDIRARAFKRVSGWVAESTYSCRPAPWGGRLGIPQGQAYLLCVPETGAVELYLEDDADRRPFKASFPIQRNKKGHPHVSPSAVFEGDVPLAWDYFALLAVADENVAGTEEAASLRQDLAALDREIIAAGQALFLSTNAAAYRNLQDAFARVAEYQTLQVELENRRRLSQRIFDGFVETVAPLSYRLDPLDFLFPLVESVSIAPRRATAKFPIEVTIKTKAGEEISAVMTGAEQIEVAGVEAPNRLLSQYLTATVIEAIVKAHGSYTEKRERRPQPRNGYIVDAEGRLSSSSEPSNEAVQVLTAIFQADLRRQLEARGLLAFTWYYFDPVTEDDGLFRPLEDQSVDGKRKALAEKGAQGLFVQIEPAGTIKPVGTIKRLPVRLKRVGGKLVLAPWERNPLREEQQRLLGDPRPLPTLYGLYVITTFSLGPQHVYLYALRPTQDEILAADVFDRAELEVRTGKFWELDLLLKHTSRARREALLAQVSASLIKIKKQELEVFPLQTTFHRPRLTSVSALLESGLRLDSPTAG